MLRTVHSSALTPRGGVLGKPFSALREAACRQGAPAANAGFEGSSKQAGGFKVCHGTEMCSACLVPGWTAGGAGGGGVVCAGQGSSPAPWSPDSSWHDGVPRGARATAAPSTHAVMDPPLSCFQFQCRARGPQGGSAMLPCLAGPAAARPGERLTALDEPATWASGKAACPPTRPLHTQTHQMYPRRCIVGSGGRCVFVRLDQQERPQSHAPCPHRGGRGAMKYTRVTSTTTQLRGVGPAKRGTHPLPRKRTPQPPAQCASASSVGGLWQRAQWRGASTTPHHPHTQGEEETHWITLLPTAAPRLRRTPA